MKHIINSQTSFLDRLFLKGDEVYINTQTYRNGGSSIDWMKVFGSDKTLLGSITSSKYWELIKYKTIDRLSDESLSYDALQSRYDKLEAEFLEKLEINILNNEDNWSRNPQQAFKLFKGGIE